MKLLEKFYKQRGKPVPYYARYSLMMLLWRPFRKYFNVVIIPNIPFSGLRIWMYKKIVGYKIGCNVFIGMKCYLDDIEPQNTTIGNNVTISYGCYFSLHGKGQSRTYIHIQNGVYIGMRATIVAGKEGLTIGENAIIGASSHVNKDIPSNTTAVGVPAKVIKNNLFNLNE